MKTINNKEFKDLLDRSDFVKTCGRMSLNIDEENFYLNILYDYSNYVFVEFDIDLGNKEIPTNKQYEMVKDYFNARLND